MTQLELPWSWLGSTVELQREAYGHVADPGDAAKTARSIYDNLFALAVEALGELPREFHWKYWSHDDPFVNRDRVLKEAVDIGHFLANILVAIGVTDTEWEAAYRRKQDVNRQRQAEGYSASAPKSQED